MAHLVPLDLVNRVLDNFLQQSGTHFALFGKFDTQSRWSPLFF